MAELKQGTKSSAPQPKDIIFPALYVIFLFVLGYFIWKLLSPIVALGFGGLVAYFHLLRDFISGSDE